MNTYKTLRDKFVSKSEYPIWYYKELQKVDITYVIFNLLKESFVVSINGSKHEITFGKNRQDEIETNIRYDDINNSKLCSYEVIEKGFKIGEWFTISDIDTSDEFKEIYRNKKEEYEFNENKQVYRNILKNVINTNENLSYKVKNEYISCVDNSSYEELKDLFDSLMKKFNRF